MAQREGAADSRGINLERIEPGTRVGGGEVRQHIARNGRLGSHDHVVAVDGNAAQTPSRGVVPKQAVRANPSLGRGVGGLDWRQNNRQDNQEGIDFFHHRVTLNY